MDHIQATAANPVYDSRTDNFRSKHIYFYYLPSHESDEKVRAYHVEAQSPLRPDEIPAEVKRLAKWVQDENPTPHGEGLGAISWRHKSYFAAVLDDHERLQAGNAFTFGFRGKGGPNHSFFDGVDVTDMDDGLSGFFCINLMRSEHGRDLEDGEIEDFHVEANHSDQANLVAPAQAPGRRDRISQRDSHTDTGTNTGPPQP